jgi:hypothetical protein
LQGQTVTLSFQAKVSATTKLDNVKCAIVAWSGTADSVTSDIISAWGAEGTNPTLIADATYENSPANLNVTTDWATYTVSAPIDTASTNNVIVFIWSDVTDTTAGDFLYLAGVQLEAGSVATPFERRPFGTELQLCQRYLTAYGPGAVYFATGNYYISTLCFCILNYNMRATPTLIATASDITIQSNGLNLVASNVAIGEANLSSMRLDVTTSAATAGNGGNARLNASGKLLLLSSEL